MSAKAFRADVKAMSHVEAASITQNIIAVLQTGYEAVVPMIVRAYRGRAWQALEFTTWADYCAEYFTGNGMLRLPDEALSELAVEGMSTRSIAAATGRSKSDVHRATRNVERPDNVFSLDNRRRPARSEAARVAHPAGKRQGDATPAVGMPAWQIVTAFIADAVGTVSYLDVTDGLGWRDAKTTGAISEASRRGEIRPAGKRDGHVAWTVTGE